MNNCTFYDIQAKDKYLVNFDGKTANIGETFSVDNCLFAASDGAIVTKATNPKIETTFVYDSYKTSDYTVASSHPLTRVEDYVNTSINLFVDPVNNNFQIKDTTIGGEKQPGDPR